jgi:DNA-binding CsgD family transcriptional regulator
VKLVLDDQAVMALVENAYAQAVPCEEWRRAIVTGLQRAVTGSRNGRWFEFQTSRVADGVTLDAMSSLVCSGHEVDSRLSFAALTALPPGQLAATLGRTHGTTASMAMGLGRTLPDVNYWHELWGAGVNDSLGLTVHEPGGAGACVCVGLTSMTSLTVRERRTLDRLAVHLAAAFRLKHRALTTADAEAILAPSGALLHASAPAHGKLAALAESHQSRAFARTSARDIATALQAWKGLSAGRWSLVDHWDTDGKRFVLAIKNPPRVPARDSLSPRERRVVALAAMGHGDKEIAYTLGISVSSIGRSLAGARAKLGVQTRVELVARWNHGAP